MPKVKEYNVIGAALINDKDEVLVARRNNDRILGDLWEFPGGKIEPGESPQEALKRELEEEFSDEIKVGSPVAQTVDYEYKYGIVHLTVFYAKFLTRNFDLIAHSQVKWLNVNNLDTLNWAPADQPVVEELINHGIEKDKF